MVVRLLPRLLLCGMPARVPDRATVPLGSGLGRLRGVDPEEGGVLGGVVAVAAVAGRVGARGWVSRARGPDSSRVRNPAASGPGGDLAVGVVDVRGWANNVCGF